VRTVTCILIRVYLGLKLPDKVEIVVGSWKYLQILDDVKVLFFIFIYVVTRVSMLGWEIIHALNKFICVYQSQGGMVLKESRLNL